jgi:hypothetical protein
VEHTGYIAHVTQTQGRALERRRLSGLFLVIDSL